MPPHRAGRISRTTTHPPMLGDCGGSAEGFQFSSDERESDWDEKTGGELAI
ncbi:hypothetical protein M407DRAFT_35186 [Tulasnella calospora MUT 4182]|uniref:Uncharacterized protein n=1 Tax=Tulasnella calospora MUT 4182 TaxID=1051891 RepID=A0A0C3PZH1_9AGAM|nr:hypothetical protein M407DRAFT_35186 [Tulasnella calospora MUT 4182]